LIPPNPPNKKKLLTIFGGVKNSPYL
jgi:hypothetical protein